VIVKETATVSGTAKVFGTVIIEEDCHIYGDAIVFGSGIIGNGSDKVSIFNNARVFGSPSITSKADMYTPDPTDGWLFGTVNITGDVAITNGDERGSVFGNYVTDQGSEYHDTKYPNKPQIRGGGQTLKLIPDLSSPTDTVTGFTGDSPTTSVTAAGNIITKTLTEATDQLDLTEILVTATRKDPFESFNSLVTNAEDLKTSFSISVDGQELEVGKDFNFLDSLGNVVTAVTSSIKLAVTATVGAVVAVVAAPFVYINNALSTPGVGHIYDGAAKTVTKLDVDTNLPINYDTSDILETFEMPNPPYI
jgi:hypothetical protein